MLEPTCTNRHTHKHIHKHTHRHTHTLTNTNTHIHTYTHTQGDAHAHTHTKRTYSNRMLKQNASTQRSYRTVFWDPCAGIMYIYIYMYINMQRFRTCGASERQLQCGTSRCQAVSSGASGRQLRCFRAPATVRCFRAPVTVRYFRVPGCQLRCFRAPVLCYALLSPKLPPQKSFRSTRRYH